MSKTRSSGQRFQTLGVREARRLFLKIARDAQEGTLDAPIVVTRYRKPVMVIQTLSGQSRAKKGQ